MFHHVHKAQIARGGHREGGAKRRGRGSWVRLWTGLNPGASTFSDRASARSACTHNCTDMQGIYRVYSREGECGGGRRAAHSFEATRKLFARVFGKMLNK